MIITLQNIVGFCQTPTTLLMPQEFMVKLLFVAKPQPDGGRVRIQGN